VLGMDDTPQYKQETALMRQAVRGQDLETIRQFTVRCSSEQIAKAAPQRKMDAVAALTRLVPTRLLGEYFGTPGPDDATAMRWMRSIFREIFLNIGNDPLMQKDAVACAKELNAYLDALIASRKAEIADGKQVPDDFLCRLLKIQRSTNPSFPDEVIRRILGGTIVGTVDTNSKAISQALDQLLNRPAELQCAQAAAQVDDDTRVAGHIFEALRFNPQNPFLIRYCTKPTTIAAGTSRATNVTEGSLVIAGTESAMFDPKKFPDPDTFKADRPYADYIHFGSGMHTCFGQHIGHVLIPGVAKQLLCCKGLRRAAGADGTLKYDGAFPNSWTIEFD